MDQQVKEKKIKLKFGVATISSIFVDEKEDLQKQQQTSSEKRKEAIIENEKSQSFFYSPKKKSNDGKVDQIKKSESKQKIQDQQQPPPSEKLIDSIIENENKISHFSSSLPTPKKKPNEGKMDKKKTIELKQNKQDEKQEIDKETLSSAFKKLTPPTITTTAITTTDIATSATDTTITTSDEILENSSKLEETGMKFGNKLESIRKESRTSVEPTTGTPTPSKKEGRGRPKKSRLSEEYMAPIVVDEQSVPVSIPEKQSDINGILLQSLKESKNDTISGPSKPIVKTSFNTSTSTPKPITTSTSASTPVVTAAVAASVGESTTPLSLLPPLTSSKVRIRDRRLEIEKRREKLKYEKEKLEKLAFDYLQNESSIGIPLDYGVDGGTAPMVSHHGKYGVDEEEIDVIGEGNPPTTTTTTTPRSKHRPEKRRTEKITKKSLLNISQKRPAPGSLDYTMYGNHLKTIPVNSSPQMHFNGFGIQQQGMQWLKPVLPKGNRKEDRLITTIGLVSNNNILRMVLSTHVDCHSFTVESNIRSLNIRILCNNNPTTTTSSNSSSSSIKLNEPSSSSRNNVTSNVSMYLNNSALIPVSGPSQPITTVVSFGEDGNYPEIVPVPQQPLPPSSPSILAVAPQQQRVVGGGAAGPAGSVVWDFGASLGMGMNQFEILVNGLKQNGELLTRSYMVFVNRL